jgi:hypothetical protein
MSKAKEDVSMGASNADSLGLVIPNLVLTAFSCL